MTGTTTNGLPYATSNDPVADGASAIQALAEALDPIAWTPWSTGVPTGYTVQLKQIGATLWVSVIGTVDVATGTTTIATGLPGGVAGGWQGCSLNYQPGLITISAAGSLVVRNQTGDLRASCQALYSTPLGGSALLDTLEEAVEEYREQPHPEPLPGPFDQQEGQS